MYQPIILSTHESHIPFRAEGVWGDGFKSKIVFRFGETSTDTPYGYTSFNRRKMISRYSVDKRAQKARLDEAGIMTPLLLSGPPSSRPGETTSGAIMAKRINHSHGIGMVKLEDLPQVMNNLRWILGTGWGSRYMFEVFERVDAEYRVHVVRDVIIHVDKKVPREEAEDVSEEVVCRNLDTHSFRTVGGMLPWDMLHDCIVAVRTLGLDFGAVDVGLRDEGREHFVFEVNSAPGMRHMVVDSYVKAFKQVLG